MMAIEESSLLPFGGYFAGRRVLVTGDTGFKGSWLCHWLLSLGARVRGIGLAPETTPSLHELSGLSGLIDHQQIDIRDKAAIESAIRSFRPEVILHLAAQALVRRSYREPVYTFETNVLGTAHVLDTACRLASPQAPIVFVGITSDKCYENRETNHAYHEEHPLGGYDPYSASKAAAELVIASWRRSFAANDACRVASVRAGNVIGGGDWSEDRIVPDCVRALLAGKPIVLRNPTAIRPWQHVLEPLSGYLALAARLGTSNDSLYRGAWNFGPDPASERSVGDLCTAVVRHWGSGAWVHQYDSAAPHEAGYLKLSSQKANDKLGWRAVWDFDRGVAETMSWYRRVSEQPAEAAEQCRTQIVRYEQDAAIAGAAWAPRAAKGLEVLPGCRCERER